MVLNVWNGHQEIKISWQFLKHLQKSLECESIHPEFVAVYLASGNLPNQDLFGGHQEKVLNYNNCNLLLGTCNNLENLTGSL